MIGIGAGNETLDRTERVLRVWAAAEPGTPAEGLTVKQEIKAIDEAMTHGDEDFLAQYGGFAGSGKTIRRASTPPGSAGDGRGLD